MELSSELHSFKSPETSYILIRIKFLKKIYLFHFRRKRAYRKMEKLKVMELNQISMSWIGIHSMHLDEPSNEFFKSISAYCILFCTVFFFIGSSAAFVYEFSSDFVLVSEPLLIVIAGLQCFGMFVSVGFNMKTIKLLHIKLQEIIDESTVVLTILSTAVFLLSRMIFSDKEGRIFNIYLKTEKRCRKITKLMACYPAMLMFTGALLYSVYCLLTGNRDTSTWILPYKMAMPFNTESIVGWYLLWLVQANVGLAYTFIMVTITSYFVCNCFYVMALADHFIHLIHSSKGDIEFDRNEGNMVSRQKIHRKMKDVLSQAISIHIKAFEYLNSCMLELTSF